MDGLIDFIFVRRLFLGVRPSIEIKKSDIKIFGLHPHLFDLACLIAVTYPFQEKLEWHSTIICVDFWNFMPKPDSICLQLLCLNLYKIF